MKDASSLLFQAIWGLSTMTLIAAKASGAALTTWSWWWLLLPQAPVFALVFGWA